MEGKDVDAFQYLVSCLKPSPDGFKVIGYDVSLYEVVTKFLRERSIEVFNAHQRPELDDLWRAFHDAAWRLCRMGVLRPTAPVPREVGGGGVRETGFSYTAAGREWLKNAEPAYVPVEPARYLAALPRASGTLKSPAFLQRAAEAARSHEACNYLACCAMCGAAAESALLALAIAKTGNEERVLDAYEQPGGRYKVRDMIFGVGAPRDWKRNFEAAFGLLVYWRDSAAHGQFAHISETEAYYSLGMLLRFANFLADSWTELTGS
jgi:hypothetical protein